jgi:hypothetical protein
MAAERARQEENPVVSEIETLPWHDGMRSAIKETRPQGAQSLLVVPAHFMAVGMSPRQAEWFKRVLVRLASQGL